MSIPVKITQLKQSIESTIVKAQDALNRGRIQEAERALARSQPLAFRLQVLRGDYSASKKVSGIDLSRQKELPIRGWRFY